MKSSEKGSVASKAGGGLGGLAPESLWVIKVSKYGGLTWYRKQHQAVRIIFQILNFSTFYY